jgi:hypothetical protein
MTSALSVWKSQVQRTVEEIWKVWRPPPTDGDRVTVGSEVM